MRLPEKKVVRTSTSHLKRSSKLGHMQNAGNRGVEDPVDRYIALETTWSENRAILGGERKVKEHDLDLVGGEGRILIPFSSKMTFEQYSFLIEEAELPGICNIFAKMLVSGLLRKKPVLRLPEKVPEEAYNWIMNNFSREGNSLTSFLDKMLWEEMQTSRSWLYVDHPFIPEDSKLSLTDRQKISPYPVLWTAENVINWKIGNNTLGEEELQRVLVQGIVNKADPDNEFHDEEIPAIWVHEIVNGLYQIRLFMELESGYEVVETLDNFYKNGERLTFIPAWPANGDVEPAEPMMSSLVAKEKALYNKVTRRNHLLYGAATYTPYITSDMNSDDFDAIVESGLGSMWKLPKDAKADILATPTDALGDMEKAIAANIEEMAKLGVRMLTPEVSQSGIALEIRNAAQTAQLGSLNERVSNIMSQVICFMVNWKYDVDCEVREIEFSLTEDFSPVPLGADWLRLATEWYENGLVPRSIWLQILKSNDIVDPDYDDEDGKAEIASDDLISRGNDDLNDFDRSLDN